MRVRFPNSPQLWRILAAVALIQVCHAEPVLCHGPVILAVVKQPQALAVWMQKLEDGDGALL